jgi:glycosyltransferase involved in cell wall biosynthesis
LVPITIFTPTYNRAYTLHKCYDSLKRQTCKDFIWLIIDDGSTDNTKKLVDRWIGENAFDIRYHFQENQGMSGAHNTAYELIDTELNVCIDSDDFMTDDAVEKIVDFWNKNRNANAAGIAALNIYTDGQVIGTKFPEQIKSSTLFDLYNRHGIKGDKKLVYRTELTKQYPYPVYEGEKYVGLDYKYKKIDLNYKLLMLNEALCVVEYMEDGSSRNMLYQYRRNPKGWAFYRIENMKNPNIGLKYKFKECVHYVASSLMLKNRCFLKEVPYKFLTILAVPIGILLYGYIIRNTSRDL